jgi:hypothetical protein
MAIVRVRHLRPHPYAADDRPHHIDALLARRRHIGQHARQALLGQHRQHPRIAAAAYSVASLASPDTTCT